MTIEVNKTYQHKNQNVVVTAIDADGYCLCKSDNGMIVVRKEELLKTKVRFDSLKMGAFYMSHYGDICVKINPYANSDFEGIVVKAGKKMYDRPGFLDWSKPETLVTPVEVEINEKNN